MRHVPRIFSREVSEADRLSRLRWWAGSQLPGFIYVQLSVGYFDVQAANMCLNNGTWTVGPPPNTLIEGCYLVERSVIIFFNFLMLLIFELGQGSFPILATHAH